MRAIENNYLEQIITLRKYHLPAEPDTEENWARSIWLENRQWENTRIAIANGIATAFKGE